MFRVCSSNIGPNNVWHSNKPQTHLLGFDDIQIYNVIFNAAVQVPT